MAFVLYTLHIFVCIFLILVVLLQQGKGADLSVFGGGGTMTAFGARGAANVFHKLTVASFVLFIVTTLTIGVLQSGGSSRTVLSDEDAAEASTAAEAEAAAEDAAPAAVPALPEDDGLDGAAVNGEDLAVGADEAPATDLELEAEGAQLEADPAPSAVDGSEDDGL